MFSEPRSEPCPEKKSSQKLPVGSATTRRPAPTSHTIGRWQLSAYLGATRSSEHKIALRRSTTAVQPLREHTRSRYHSVSNVSAIHFIMGRVNPRRASPQGSRPGPNRRQPPTRVRGCAADRDKPSPLHQPTARPLSALWPRRVVRHHRAGNQHRPTRPAHPNPPKCSGSRQRVSSNHRCHAEQMTVNGLISGR